MPHPTMPIGNVMYNTMPPNSPGAMGQQMPQVSGVPNSSSAYPPSYYTNPKQQQRPVQNNQGFNNYPRSKPPQSAAQNPSPASGAPVNYPPSALPHTTHVNVGRRSVHSFFMAEHLRQELHNRTGLILKGSDPDDPACKGLPERLGAYHSLYPLENEQPNSPLSRTFGVPTTTYKGLSIRDGLPYAIRKVDCGHMRFSEYGFQQLENWKQIQHPSIVTLRDHFKSNAFDSVNGTTNGSLFFVYDYHPGAQTLHEKYFTTGSGSPGSGQPSSYFSEDILWSFITQLVSAIECIHRSGQACKHTISPTKIIVTGKNRIRIGSVGIEDVLLSDVHQHNPHSRNLVQQQYHDLHFLGQLIVTLACKSLDAMSNFAKSMEHISNTYSQELQELIITLCNTNSNNKRTSYPTIHEICQLIHCRILDQVDRLYCHNDNLESELAKETENGRLFRLVCKLGFVNERPDQPGGVSASSAWSETGDRYLAKLFRDYVFHQVQSDGSPVLDLQHVVECLNKLDIGSEEKIMLMSRDEKSMLIVSYKDVKRILNECFNLLVTKQAQSDITKQLQQQAFSGYSAMPYTTTSPLSQHYQ